MAVAAAAGGGLQRRWQPVRQPRWAWSLLCPVHHLLFTMGRGRKAGWSKKQKKEAKDGAAEPAVDAEWLADPFAKENENFVRYYRVRLVYITRAHIRRWARCCSLVVDCGRPLHPHPSKGCATHSMLPSGLVQDRSGVGVGRVPRYTLQATSDGVSHQRRPVCSSGSACTPAAIGARSQASCCVSGSHTSCGYGNRRCWWCGCG